MSNAEFWSEPAIVQVVRDEPGMFRVVQPVVFYSAKLRRPIRVPAGYLTDFASIPKFLRDRLDVNGKSREAAVVHDYGCTNKADLGLSQKQVDDLLDEANEALGVDKWERRAMIWGVRPYQRFQCWRRGESYA